MIKAKLINNGSLIELTSNSIYEMEEVRRKFVKHIPDWFILKKKYKAMDVDICFMDDNNMISRGLWVELVNACTSLNIQLEFIDDFGSKIADTAFNKDLLDGYLDRIFSNSELSIRDYQKDAVSNILKYKNCCVEVSTSGGKTLIAYSVFKYMIDVLRLKHILFVTPNTNLTTQTSEKFVKYDEMNGIEQDWTYSEIYAKAKKKSEYDDTIVFGNYQSLCRKSKDFFLKFDAVIVDECHHTKSKSIKTIVTRCKNAKYKIGMTGTFPKSGSYESFYIQMILGPVVYKLSQYDLINKEKFATPVHVALFEMSYLTNDKLNALYELRMRRGMEDVTFGSKILGEEQTLARNNKLRFRYICDMIKKTTKNTLVIFSDVQNEYGTKVYNEIKECSDKNVYYIDGGVTNRVRDDIKNAMENDFDGNTVIIASMGCFSEGIDIANLWNIFLIESTKSDNILAQILGRGMRMFEGKEKTMMIDFVDDFRYGSDSKLRDNYLYKQGKKRQEIYKERGFPLSVFPVELQNTALI